MFQEEEAHSNIWGNWCEPRHLAGGWLGGLEKRWVAAVWQSCRL